MSISHNPAIKHFGQTSNPEYTLCGDAFDLNKHDDVDAETPVFACGGEVRRFTMSHSADCYTPYAKGKYSVDRHIWQRNQWAVYSPEGVCIDSFDSRQIAQQEADRLNEIPKLLACTDSASHLTDAHLASCSWCRRDFALSRD